MRSGITDLGDGVFIVWLDMGRVDGKRPRQQVRVKGLRAAQRRRKEFEQDAHNATLVLTNRATVKELVDMWLTNFDELVVAGSKAPKTAERYHEIAANYIVPSLGSTRLDAMQRNPVIVRRFLADELDHGGLNGRPLSPQSVVHIGRVLGSACQWAVTKKTMVGNPVRTEEVRELLNSYLQRARREAKHTRLTVAQMLQLAEESRGTLLFLPTVIAICSGMRRGEVLGLHWCDIDFAGGTLTLRRSLSETRDGIFEKPPKTKNGARTIVLPGFCVMELQAAKAALGPLATPDGYVCCHADGSPIAPDAFSAHFGTFRRRHNLPDSTFHGLRHSHAAHLVSRKQPAKEVSKRLGHGGISITMDLYADLFEEVDREAATAVDADFREVLRQFDVNEGSSAASQRHLRLVK